MKISIDGKPVIIYSKDKNIVDVTDRENIALPAPCYHNNRQKGCCKVCLVEINNEKKYACVTKPISGMNIIINRPDLNIVRSENARKYKELPEEVISKCECNCSCAGSNCC